MAQREQGLAFDPLSRRLAFVDLSGRPQLWNIKTGTIKRLLPVEDLDSIQAHVWNKNNVLIAGTENSVRLYDSANGRRIRTLDNLPRTRNRSFQYDIDHYAQCVVSPSGKLAAFGMVHGAVSVWDITRGQRLFTLKVPNVEICGLALSADDSTLATGHILLKKVRYTIGSSFEDTGMLEIILRDALTGKVIRRLRWNDSSIYKIADYQGELGHMGLAFSSDGKLLASGTPTNINTWNARTGHLLYQIHNNSNPLWGGQKWLVFSRDSALLVGGGWGEQVSVWSATDGHLLQFFNISGSLNSIALSPDAHWLATAGQDHSGSGFVKIWDVSGMK